MTLKKSYPLLESTNPWICTAGRLSLSIRIVNAIYRKHLKQHKITMSQLSIMMVIGKSKEILQSELGRMLRLERSTTTRDLKRLIEQGFVEKKVNGHKVIISMTDKGARHTEEIIPDWLKATNEARERLGGDGDQALNLVLQKLSI